jgi:hypothetical protein
MSGIGWIDFSSDDRDRVRNVLALLKEKGTLDELGIGQVRDAYSDLLFPGFSTIQTRARYFLTIPKIMHDWAGMSPAQRRRVPLDAYLRNAENDLARTLKSNYEALNLQPEHVIGHTVIEKGGVARTPSSTYWNGLRQFGIIKTPKSLAEFCREWRQGAEAPEAVDADEGNDDGDPRVEAEVRRPPYYKGAWREGLTLDLDRREAIFLQERFQTKCQSVAAQLLTSGLAEVGIADERANFAVFSLWASKQSKLSREVRDCIRAGQRFSDGIEGAHIIFNRLLAEKLEHDVLRDFCREEYRAWKDRTAIAGIFHATSANEWLERPLTAKASIHPRTAKFLEAWSGAMHGRASATELDSLIRKQAEQNKQIRSLLVRPPRKQDAAWYGVRTLDYRWSTARRMIRDVVEGQKCST